MSRITIAAAALLLAGATPLWAQSASGSSESSTFFAFQVDKEAQVKVPARPQFPERLRADGIGGEVLVQFVVDERGAPMMDTFKVLRSTHALFTDAVRRAVGSTSFHPAETQGRKVKQLVQQPFVFRLER